MNRNGGKRKQVSGRSVQQNWMQWHKEARNALGSYEIDDDKAFVGHLMLPANLFFDSSTYLHYNGSDWTTNPQLASLGVALDTVFAQETPETLYHPANDTMYQVFRYVPGCHMDMPKWKWPEFPEEEKVLVVKDMMNNMEHFVCKSRVSLGSQLEEWRNKFMPDTQAGIRLEITLNENFPTDPPFVRVITPRMQQWSGHITIGGSICTIMLTNCGQEGSWKPDFCPEGIFHQLVQLFKDGDAKVDFNNGRAYTLEEARAAFTRVAAYHGWN